MGRLISQGRQISPTVDGVRDDHVARYEFAAAQIIVRLGVDARVIDMGCGTGYGSFVMREFGILQIAACDIDGDAIEFARQNYAAAGITNHQINANDGVQMPAGDAVVAMEIVEHLPNVAETLAVLKQRGFKLFVGSVPNEDIVPFDPPRSGKYHVRHYTPGEIAAEMEDAGWTIVKIGCQIGKRGAEARVRFDRTHGRTIIFVAT